MLRRHAMAVALLLAAPAAASCAMSHEREGTGLESADEATLVGCTGMAEHAYVEVYGHVSDGWIRVRSGEAIHGFDRAEIVRTSSGSPPWREFSTPDDSTTNVEGYLWERAGASQYHVEVEAIFAGRTVQVTGDFDASAACPD